MQAVVSTCRARRSGLAAVAMATGVLGVAAGQAQAQTKALLESAYFGLNGGQTQALIHENAPPSSRDADLGLDGFAFGGFAGARWQTQVLSLSGELNVQGDLSNGALGDSTYGKKASISLFPVLEKSLTDTVSVMAFAGPSYGGFSYDFGSSSGKPWVWGGQYGGGVVYRPTAFLGFRFVSAGWRYAAFEDDFGTDNTWKYTPRGLTTHFSLMLSPW